MRYFLLHWVFPVVLSYFLVALFWQWDMFKILSPRSWRKMRFRVRKEHERDERRRRWRKALKKTSAVPRGISPR